MLYLKALTVCCILLHSEIVHCNSKSNKLLIEAYFDNKDLISAIQSTKSVNDDRLRIVISVVKEMILEKQVSKDEWLPTTKQLVNSLTK